MVHENRSILIVDDEPDLRDILSFSFERKGYNIFSACNAVEALKIVKRCKIDVIISDIRMPGGDGVQLLEEVKKHNPNIPMMLFITGFADITMEEAYDKGVDAIFSKPFDTKVLLAAVEKMLEKNEDHWRRQGTHRDKTLLAVDLKFQDFKSAQQAHVLNVGRGGLFIRLTENFPRVNDLLNFRIVFNEGPVTIIEGEGRVKWVRSQAVGDLPAGCGVEFVSLNDKSRGKIFELINFVKTQQYIPKT